MSEPRRIQRRRTKGWRAPAGVKYVGRPSLWGNPFATGDAVADVAAHRDWLLGCLTLGMIKIEELVEDLGAYDLMDWCELGSPCHADTLLAFANDPWTLIRSVQ